MSHVDQPGQNVCLNNKDPADNLHLGQTLLQFIQQAGPIPDTASHTEEIDVYVKGLFLCCFE